MCLLCVDGRFSKIGSHFMLCMYHVLSLRSFPCNYIVYLLGILYAVKRDISTSAKFHDTRVLVLAS